MLPEEFYIKINEAAYKQWDNKKDIIKLSPEGYRLLHEFFLKKIKIEPITDKDLKDLEGRILSHIVLSGHVYAIELTDLMTLKYEPLWRDYKKGEEVNLKNVEHYEKGIIKERLQTVLQVVINDYNYGKDAYPYHNLSRMRVYPKKHN